jgi:cytochrome c oxidase subunit 2
MKILFLDIPLQYHYYFQDSSTYIMEAIINLYNYIFFYLIIIFIFISWMLFRTIYIFKYNNKIIKINNPFLEIIWTIIPAIILYLIGIKSFKLLYVMDECINPKITIKILGYQWFWTYEYPNNNYGCDIIYNSIIKKKFKLNEGHFRLLDVDNPMFVPEKTHIRLIITSMDVIHSWTVPSFGIKVDAIPGRLNQTSLFIKRKGIYYGQCSELCGVNHAFMPIVVKAEDKDVYITRLAQYYFYYSNYKCKNQFYKNKWYKKTYNYYLIIKNLKKIKYIYN